MIAKITTGEILSSIAMLMGAATMIGIVYIDWKMDKEDKKKNKQHQKHKNITNNCY